MEQRGLPTTACECEAAIKEKQGEAWGLQAKLNEVQCNLEALEGIQKSFTVVSPVYFRPEHFGDPSPNPPDGYRYGFLGGHMTCFDEGSGERIPQTRFLIPLSGCLFDASDDYALPGVVYARATGSKRNRLMVCGCEKCQ